MSHKKHEEIKIDHLNRIELKWPPGENPKITNIYDVGTGGTEYLALPVETVHGLLYGYQIGHERALHAAAPSEADEHGYRSIYNHKDPYKFDRRLIAKKIMMLTPHSVAIPDKEAESIIRTDLELFYGLIDPLPLLDAEMNYWITPGRLLNPYYDSMHDKLSDWMNTLRGLTG